MVELRQKEDDDSVIYHGFLLDERFEVDQNSLRNFRSETKSGRMFSGFIKGSNKLEERYRRTLRRIKCSQYLQKFSENRIAVLEKAK